MRAGTSHSVPRGTLFFQLLERIMYSKSFAFQRQKLWWCPGVRALRLKIFVKLDTSSVNLDQFLVKLSEK